MQADDELALLKHTIMQGWPKSIKEVPPVLQPFWTFREELTVEDGLILKGTRIVIPNKQWETILKLIHKGHLGLIKCKLHAKETVYWPGLNDQLEDVLLNCELCLKYSISKCKQEPSLLLGPQMPLHPWTKLATDVFHFEGVSYLLIVDYTSRFPVVCNLTLMTGQHIANHFKFICSEYGWPEALVSDNGPCYTSEVFTNLMKEYNVIHIINSPQSAIQWISWKICTACKELVLYGQRGKKRLVYVWCCIATLHYQTICTHQCKYLQEVLQGQVSPCQMQQVNKSVKIARTSELNIKMNICHCMTYIWSKHSCIKIQQLKDGFQPTSHQAVSRSQKLHHNNNRGYPIWKDSSPSWSHTILKTRQVKMNWSCKITICGHLKYQILSKILPI